MARPPAADQRAFLSAIVENSNDAIFARNFDGTIVTWNAAAARMFGYSERQILGKSSRVLLPARRRDEFQELVRRLRKGKVVAHFETERLRKNRTIIQVSLTLSLVRDRQNRPIGFSTIARDITEQRRLQNALAERERELNDFFDNASVGLLLVSPAGLVLRANRAFAALLERDSSELAGTTLHKAFADPLTLTSLLRRLRARETFHNQPMDFLTLDGARRHALVDVDGKWDSGRLLHSRWFVRDVSRRRRLERELLQISDRERRRIAQDLHDGLGQQLGGVAYLCNVVRERLLERQAPEAATAERIFDLVRRAIQDTRRIARGLSPVREAPEGLLDSLKDLAAGTTEIHGIPCAFVCREPTPIQDPGVASHLFRIAQEAVNNVIKHAGARTIRIVLNRSRTRLSLCVLDDGRGFQTLSPNREGLGLGIMRYRANLLGAQLEVRPRLPHGTTVRCSAPYSPAPCPSRND